MVENWLFGRPMTFDTEPNYLIRTDREVRLYICGSAMTDPAPLTKGQISDATSG